MNAIASKILVVCVIASVLVASESDAQPTFQNPSFEGAPVAGAAPPGWFICTGSPDVMPGFWGTTQAPSHGSSYLGFHHEESVSANFPGGLGTCNQMTFEMDVSIVPLGLQGNGYWDANNQGVNNGYICIYGGYTSCDNAELLWQSPLITNVSAWQTLLVQLSPSQNYTYLNIVPCLNTYGSYSYFGIDNIVMIDQTPLVDPLADAAYCEGDAITIDLTGGFSSNATFAWTGPNGFTSTQEDVVISSSALSDAGQYSVTVSENGCSSQVISAQITVVDCTPNNLTCNLLCNTDFEDQQVIGAGNFTLVNQSSVPCWSTTAADQQVEVWGTGFLGVPAYSGNQFIELNANLVSTIYQDFQALPGSTVDVSFAHRGRSGTDVMSVSIGPVGGPYTVLGTFSTGNSAWGFYTVSYTFPSIPQVNYSLRFNSISAAGGNPGVGNFLDDISIIMPQLVVVPTITDPSCTFSEDGQVNLAISGGSAPYQVQWDAPLTSTSTSIMGLGDGIYGYTITDLYGCQYSDIVTLQHQFSESPSSSSIFICQGESHVLPSGLIVSQSGIYLDTLQTTNGCDSVITTNLTVHPSYSFIQNVSICDGSVHTLPSGMNIGVGGTYVDTLQSMNGCDSIITTQLTVHPSPVITEQVSICYGQSYLAQGSMQFVAGTYYDTLSTNFGCDSVIITELSIQNIIVHVIDTMVCVGDSVFTAGNWKTAIGTYNDTLVTPLGCDSLVITALGHHPLPTANISVQNACLDIPLSVSDASSVASGSIAGWNWDFGNGNSSVQQQAPQQSYASAGIYTIALQVWSDHGCTDSTQTNVEIYPLPTAQFTFDSVCHGQLVSFVDQSFASGPYPIMQWEWSFSDGQSSIIQNPFMLFTDPGLYSALLTVTTSVGCKADTTLGDAQVYPNPVAIMQPLTPHCLYDMASLQEASLVDEQWGDAVVSWLWNTDNTIFTTANASHQYGSAGVQPVSLQVETANGCSHQVSGGITVFERPVVDMSLSVQEGCEPLGVLYIDESQISGTSSIASWNWSLGNGSGSAERQPFVTHQHLGSSNLIPDTLSVSLAVTSSDGCASMDTAVATIVVFPLPQADFSASPTRTSMVNPKIELSDASSANVSSWNWHFGDGQQSIVQNPVHSYGDTGSYEVELIVLTEYGCSDQKVLEVKIEPHFSCYIPNGFTPNGDGRNDLFMASGEGFVSPVLSIYNRWGEELYYGEDDGAAWDGIYKGRAVEAGVYLYLVKVTDWEGTEHVYRGRVSLLR